MPVLVQLRCEQHDRKRSSRHYSVRLEYGADLSVDKAIEHAQGMADKGPCRACGGTVVVHRTTGRP